MCEKYGIKVVDDEIPYCPAKQLTRRLNELGIRDRFDELYGIQTQSMHGPYACDVEQVLLRIYK